jgi:P27 family predicted phage terminase small subunit
MKPEPAPHHLSTAAKALWMDIQRSYQLEGRHSHLLKLALESLDRAEAARKQVTKDGLMLRGPKGIRKPHPLLNVERDARLAYARLMRELGLDDEPREPAVRPPRVKPVSQTKRYRDARKETEN